MNRTIAWQRAMRSLVAVITLAAVVPAYAQTQGMERRDNRRDNRAGGRAAKQACKAGDEHSRMECRQLKRHTKQAGRQGAGDVTPNGAPAGNGVPAPNPAQ
jgi:hypothetical protein